MIRICLMALLVSSLHRTAIAQAVPLSDSEILGQWVTESGGWLGDTITKLWEVTHFTPDHKYEHMGWLRRKTYPGNTIEYIGARHSGTWSIRDTLLLTVPKECQGFTESGSRECGNEVYGPDRADTLKMKMQDAAKKLVWTNDFVIVDWDYAGPERNMRPPDFWPQAVSIRYGRIMTGGSARATAIDVLGRKAVESDAARREPLMRFARPESGGKSGPADLPQRLNQ